MKSPVLIFTVLLLLSALFSLTGLYIPGSGGQINFGVFKGYLSDVKCAESNNGVTSDGINLKLHPEKHAVECMKTVQCAMSGYGLFIKSGNGSYSFYRFDKNGIKLSKELLKKTVKKKGITVDVTGEMKDNIIYVADIREI